MLPSGRRCRCLWPLGALRVPDPIYAAIEAHKTARAAFEASVSRHSALDRELPIEKGRSRISAWEETIVETDDPRWIECERTLTRCMDAESDAACVLVSILSTTMAGVVALLRYAVDADTDGEGWPPVVESDDGQTRSWRHSCRLIWPRFTRAGAGDGDKNSPANRQL